MTRIGSTGLGGLDLILQSNISRTLSRLGNSGTRLATLSQINRAADDPAGLISLESIRAELTALEQADRNASRAASAIRVADSGLSQVSSILNDIRGALVESAGNLLSDEQLSASQTLIDAGLDALNRIGATSGFNDVSLLDGEELAFLFAPDPNSTVSIAMPQIASTALGGSAGRLSDLASGGSASLASGNSSGALETLDAASSQVVEARAKLGAFEKFTIESSRQVVQASQINISAAISQIGDTDIAAESALFIREQILAKTGLAALKIGSERRSLIASLLDVI